MKIKTFQNSGHAKQNLQGAYKIMNAPCESSSNSEESVSLVLVFWWMRSSCTVAIRSFFFFFVGGRPPRYSRVALQFCVHRFSPSLGETLRHLEPGVNKKCHEHHTIILGVIDLCRTEGH